MTEKSVEIYVSLKDNVKAILILQNVITVMVVLKKRAIAKKRSKI